jgi:preprotein translocase subunit SecF
MSPEPIRPGSARRRRDAAQTPESTPAVESVEESTATAPPGTESPAAESPVADDLLVEEVVADSVEVVPESEPTEVEALIAATDTEEVDPGLGGAQRSVSTRRHGPFARLYFGETNLDFVGRRRIWFAASLFVILIGVVSLSTRGLNLGIDFVGGTSWTVKANSVTVAQASNTLSSIGFGGSTVTILGGTGSGAQLNVEAKVTAGKANPTGLAEQNKVSDALAKLAGVPASTVSVNTVGPTWGSQITHKAVVALIVFFILIALYISVFFEWRMALAAIIAVFHDILVTVGIYSLTGFEVTPDTVVAFLTILGYSLYDTIVVFDRVRDNTKSLAERGRLTFSDLVNLSMNQTLARSINTSLVAIMPILAVLVLGAEILGAQTLQYFGLALLIGLTTGAYSSLFIASPLVAVMKEREPRYRRIRERIAARPPEHLVLSPAAVAAGLLGTDLVTAPRETDGPESTGASTRRDSRPKAPPRARPSRPAARTKRRGGRR